MSLPVVTPEPEKDWDRWHALWAELKFRRKAIGRVYPDARFRSSHGPFWDMSGPAVEQVIIGDSVHYDHEMSLLSRAIDACTPAAGSLKRDMDASNTKQWPQHDHAIVQMNQYFDLLVACACSDEDWERDDVQNIWMRMMGKKPLDELAKVAPED